MATSKPNFVGVLEERGVGVGELFFPGDRRELLQMEILRQYLCQCRTAPEGRESERQNDQRLQREPRHGRTPLLFWLAKRQ
jgi:hypothetical protein